MTPEKLDSALRARNVALCRRPSAPPPGDRPRRSGLLQWLHSLRWAARLGALAFATAWVWPGRAGAHTRWFTTVADAFTPPLALTTLFGSPLFLPLFLATVAVVAGVQAADRGLRRRCDAAGSLSRRVDEMTVSVAPALLRLAIALYFASIAAFFSTAPVTLTPELKAGSSWVVGAQLLVAGSLLSAGGVGPAAVGVLVLYVYSAHLYGWVHLIDYHLFIGVFAFLLLHQLSPRQGASTGLLLLRVLVGTSFLWVGIEKWLYPDWTADVLLHHLPMLLMGYEPGFVVMAAGFVEVALAFLLVFGRLSSQVSAAVLLSLVCSAIPLAGVVDAIGHLPMIAALLILAATRNRLPEPVQELVAARPTDLGGTFVITVTGLTGLYFLTHQLAASVERGGYSGNVTLSLLWSALLVAWIAYALASERRLHHTANVLPSS